MEQDSKRAILAVILSGIVLFGWQYLFPTPVVTPAVEGQPTENVTDNNTYKSSSGTESVKAVDSNNTKPVNKVSSIEITNKNFQYTVDNQLNILKTKSINSDIFYPGHFQNISSEFYAEIQGVESKPFFNFEKLNDTSYSFRSSDSVFAGSVTLTDKGFLNFKITSQVDFKYKFLISTDKIEENMQQYNQFLVLSKDLETIAVGDDETIDAAEVKWFGTDYNYNMSTYLFTNPTLHRVRTIEVNDPKTGDTTAGKLFVSSLKPVKSLEYSHVFAQKNYDDLLALGNKLELSVDFGLMSIVAVPILRGLQFFYTVFPNYGISIILLTILIRMLTFPLQYKSFKSMKKMQVIQPELTALKEKYSDDPKRMQQETMALFKRAGANPLSGCLPLLLQMPVFFAFYKVLYTAVELVDAEFAFWILDLSQKDPYYVLPVLMSLAMFLNMKLTPSTTADPAQQKIMMFMPLFFGFIMKDLPAGLTLYIFISTIVGMLQQLFVYKRVS